MLKRLLQKIIRQGRHINLGDGVISRSMAMGMVIGFSPTIGLQMVLCLIISLTANYFRKNIQYGDRADQPYGEPVHDGANLHLYYFTDARS